MHKNCSSCTGTLHVQLANMNMTGRRRYCSWNMCATSSRTMKRSPQMNCLFHLFGAGDTHRYVTQSLDSRSLLAFAAASKLFNGLHRQFSFGQVWVVGKATDTEKPRTLVSSSLWPLAMAALPLCLIRTINGFAGVEVVIHVKFQEKIAEATRASFTAPTVLSIHSAR